MKPRKGNGPAAHSCDWRATAAATSSDEQLDCKQVRDACCTAVFVHRQFMSVLEGDASASR